MGKKQNVNTVLVKQMRRNGYTINSLADKMGISRSTIIRKKNGQTEWTLNEAIYIKNLLGWPGSLEELFETKIERVNF